MREIKFRAWDNKDKQMLEVPDIYDLLFEDGNFFYYASTDWARKNVILMQYTGLRDKHGKEIYEGDRVAINGNTELAGTVVWEHSAFAIKWDKRNKRAELIGKNSEPIFHNCNISLEVIGNIYENHNLRNGSASG